MLRCLRNLAPCLTLLLLIPAAADACIVRYRPAAELKQKAEVVVVAVVKAREVSGRSAIGEFYIYKVNVESTVRGDVENGDTQVTYYNYRAHVRDGVMECPLKHGSGLELDLEVGQRYRFFLRSAVEKEILFTEVVN